MDEDMKHEYEEINRRVMEMQERFWNQFAKVSRFEA